MSELSRGAALDFLQQRYGGFLRDVQGFLTLAGDNEKVLGYDGERVNLLFANLSESQMWLAPKPMSAQAQGFPLPAGGVVSFDVSSDALLPCVEWYVFGDTNDVLYYLYVHREIWQPYSGS